MALIPTVGRKSLKMRILIGALYVVLSIGAATMVYPFLVMLSTSVKSGVDVNTYSVVPSYLHDDQVLFAKFIEMKYAGDMDAINACYGSDFVKIEDIKPSVPGKLSPKQQALVDDWNEFCKSLPAKYKQTNYGAIGASPSKLLDAYRALLQKRFHGDIDALNRLYREENTRFEQVFTPFERQTKREWQPQKNAKMQEWQTFKASLPLDYLRVVGVDALFANFLKVDKYQNDIKNVNMAYGTSCKAFTDLHFSPTLPVDPRRRKDWEEFARTVLPFAYMRVSDAATPAYRTFLAKRYPNRIAEFNRIYRARYASFGQVQLPEALPSEGTPLTDWMDFIAQDVPVTAVRAENAENVFRSHVLVKYRGLAGVNRAYGLNLTDSEQLAPPYQLADWSYVQENHSQIVKHFLTRNYGLVIGYIILHGRAVFNTIVFCLAVILTSLIVNPFCAYALSRYSLPYAYKVLLFLLATMAFPAEVAMIPNFLLIKQLGMLNTYWALILPGMASGYSIFLLKGFFDSLPKELYEAGIIDGASEPRMFWQITVPLSKPIFAVIALQAFTAAYGAFMFAFLVCQNPKMWTMMVWLYELQISAPKYITMAALSVAALPTLLVFIFAQNMIMRGIILPSFK